MSTGTAAALFLLGYLAFVCLVLSFFRSRRRERCDRCGSVWRRTERGGEFHLCATPNRRVAR